MKTSHFKLLAVVAAILLPMAASAQVNSGSDGHDGALNPTGNLVIDMADHPDGIYHYTSVNIPAGVTVSFIPNAGNKPVVWLVQSDCLINGVVDVAGKSTTGPTSGLGGPGGPGGGLGGNGGTNFSAGQGPGGGTYFANTSSGVGGTFGSQGTDAFNGQYGNGASPIYGNSFLLPLLGGSGGGGHPGLPTYGFNGGAGGGGGAILIAASNSIEINGQITAKGGNGSGINHGTWYNSGAGSGGGVRLVATNFKGVGTIVANGGGGFNYQVNSGNQGGEGRVRIDAFQRTFGGSISGIVTQGFQPIILPVSGQGIQLGIASVAGAAVPANPSGVQASPDVIIPAQQTNPIPVVVRCTNVPLNTEISVVVHPANGPDVQATGLNNAGTLASSTATLSLNMPRGGGIIYAKAVTGIGGTASVTSPAESKTRSLAETGWTADGERFAKMEITAALGGRQQITYITESGKRYPAN